MLERRVLAGFEEDAEERGEARGEARGQRTLVVRLLTRRLGALSERDAAAIEALPAALLPDLAEALLDFSSHADLERWLAQQSA